MASRQIEVSYLAVIMSEAIAHRKHAGTIEARRPYHELSGARSQDQRANESKASLPRPNKQ